MCHIIIGVCKSTPLSVNDPALPANGPRVSHNLVIVQWSHLALILLFWTLQLLDKVPLHQPVITCCILLIMVGMVWLLLVLTQLGGQVVPGRWLGVGGRRLVRPGKDVVDVHVGLPLLFDLFLVYLKLLLNSRIDELGARGNCTTTLFKCRSGYVIIDSPAILR